MNNLSTQQLILGTGLVTATGNILYINGLPFATAANLQLTGQVLYNDIIGLSGQFNTNFATVTNLTQTGIIIEGQINSLSGYSASAANLLLTGQQAWNAANNNGINLSGNLTQTGIALINRINSSSGQLLTYISQTGSTLYNDIIGFSGLFTGQTGSFYPLNGNPSHYMFGGVTGVSGIQIVGTNNVGGHFLISDGTGIYPSDLLTFDNLNQSLILGNISGSLIIGQNSVFFGSLGAGETTLYGGVFPLNISSIAKIGDTDINFDNFNLFIDGVNNVFSVGFDPQNNNNVLYYNGTNLGLNTKSPSYTLDVFGTARITGNQLVLGNELLSTTGNNLYINGNIISGGGGSIISTGVAGVSSLNSASGALNFTGAGGLSIIVNGQNFIVSGNTGLFIPLSSSGAFVDLINSQTIVGLKAFSNNIVAPSIGGAGAGGKINFTNSHLQDSSTNVKLDWLNQGLSGNWNLGTATGSFISTGQTGQLLSNYLDRITSNGQLVNGSVTFSSPINANSISHAGFGGGASFQNSTLYNVTDSSVLLDWSKRILSGNWNSNGLSVNGVPVSTIANNVSIYQSSRINFLSTGDYNLLTVSGGYIFVLDTMEIITTNITTPSQAPYFSFGNSSNNQNYKTITQTTSNTSLSRHVVQNPQDGIAAGTNVTFSILTASTAAIHSGYAIVKGYYINA